MRLPPGARVAVIGAGPGGLVAAKHACDAGFDVTVFEASADLGGQWQTSAPHSGVWPDMHTNTSRAMTAFSDLLAPAHHPLHPAATQILAYLRAYAERFGVTERIRFASPVRALAAARRGPGWTVDGESFAGVVIASGRFRRPAVPPGLAAFAGEILHAFDYPGAEPFRGRRTLVIGNGVSGLEIAADLATVAPVVSSFRKPRYVIQKVVDGVSSDWQWYTLFGALQRERLPRDALVRALRERVLAIAGDPADFGAPAPDRDILAAGLSLCQDFLPQVAAGRIVCRPGVAAIRDGTVTFTDGTTDAVDAIVCATGYALDLPYLDAELRRGLGPDLVSHHQPLHPDLHGLGVVGQFLLQGPYFPLIELQARWIVAVWAGIVPSPDTARMRAAMAVPQPTVLLHHMLALALAAGLGVTPDLLARPDLTEALVFGPLLPARHRLDGPGALPDAPERFAEQVAASPRAPVDGADVAALRELGLAVVADRLGGPATAGGRTG